MKFKFPQFVKNNNDYEEYNDEEYYGFEGADGADDGFGISDVADDAPAGTYPIKLTVVDAYSNGRVPQTVSVVIGSIVVE